MWLAISVSLHLVSALAYILAFVGFKMKEAAMLDRLEQSVKMANDAFLNNVMGGDDDEQEVRT